MDNTNNQPPNPNPAVQGSAPTAPEVPTSVATPPPAPAEPTPPPAATPTAPGGAHESPKSNKTLLFVILAIVLVVVFGTIYVIMMGKTETPAPVVVEPTPTVAPTATPTPTPSAEEIEGMDIGDPQEDIDSINQDLNAL